MIAPAIVILLITLAGSLEQNPHPLWINEILSDTITSDDPTIALTHPDEQVQAKRYSLGRLARGKYTALMRSYCFDGLLILRDETGEQLKKKVDGWYASHPRLEFDVQSDTGELFLDACARNDDRGTFELKLIEGTMPTFNADDKLEAARNDGEEIERIYNSGEIQDSTWFANMFQRHGYSLWALNRFEEAESYYERAFEIASKATALDSLLIVEIFNGWGYMRHIQQKFDEAHAKYQEAIDFCVETFGPEHQTVGTVYLNQAWMYHLQHENDIAISLVINALEIFQKTLEPDDRLLGVAFFRLGCLYGKVAEYQEGISCMKQAIGIFESRLDNKNIAMVLHTLSKTYIKIGEYSKAQTALERLHAINAELYDQDHENEAAAICNQALLFIHIGRYTEARSLLEEAFETYNKVVSYDHEGLNTCLFHLATVYRHLGNYVEARSLLIKAFDNYVKLYTIEHSLPAKALKELSSIMMELGDYSEAKSMLEKSAEIYGITFDEEHILVADSLVDLAQLEIVDGNYIEAESLLMRALTINKKKRTADSFETANCHTNLGSLYLMTKQYAKAEKHFNEAVTTMGKVDQNHPGHGAALEQMGLMYMAMRNFDEARPLLERSLAIHKAAFGNEHPHTARGMTRLAMLHCQQGDHEAAWAMATEAFASNRILTDDLLCSLTEHERMCFVEEKRQSMFILLSLADTLNSPEMESAAYEALLQWKGQVSKSLLKSREFLVKNENPEVRRIFGVLQGVSAELSKEFYTPPNDDPAIRQNRLDFLREESRRMESKLYYMLNQDKGFIENQEIVTLKTLRASLPDNAAVIDFFVYPFYGPVAHGIDSETSDNEWTQDRLKAWIYRKKGEVVHAIDLGPVDRIHESVRSYLEKLTSMFAQDSSNDHAAEYTAANNRLRELLWNPYAAHLEGAEKIIVSPDSFLGGLPLDTIRLETGNHLIQNHSFINLQNMASLVSLKQRSRGMNNPALLVAGAIDYQNRGDLSWRKEIPSAPSNIKTYESLLDRITTATLRSHTSARWKSLPNTNHEIKSIADLHINALPPSTMRLLLDGEEATEERIKAEVSDFNIVHFATHGFFRPFWRSSYSVDLRADNTSGAPQESLEMDTSKDRPGLLSGLVLAGANTPAGEEREDGILTAEEIRMIDLTGVNLAVLSACETGLGSPTSGEGMLSLSRAFLQAGANSVIPTLWKVDDQATSLFFSRFYRYLWLDGLSPAEALRQAKLDMIEGKILPNGNSDKRGVKTKPVKKADSYKSPVYWGAFIYYGADM